MIAVHYKSRQQRQYHHQKKIKRFIEFDYRFFLFPDIVFTKQKIENRKIPIFLEASAISISQL